MNKGLEVSGELSVTENLNMVSGKFKGKRPFGVIKLTDVNSKGGNCNSKCENEGYLNCMAGFTSDTTVSGDKVDNEDETEYLLQYRECTYDFSGIDEDDDDYALCFCNNYLD